MFWTIVAVIALVIFLFLVLAAMGHYLNEGGFFGWLMYWNLLDVAGKVLQAICVLIVGMFNQDS